MCLSNWLYTVLVSAGLWKKETKILLLGLDNAGKTSMLHVINAEHQRLVKHNLLPPDQPTQYPKSEELSIGKIKFKAFDLSGHQLACLLTEDFYDMVDGIVYLVDAADKERFFESKKQLNAILSVKSLTHVPVVVLGNKSDILHAASEHELRCSLGLTHRTTGKWKVT